MFSFNQNDDVITANYDDITTNIYRKAKNTNQGLIPYDALEAIIKKFTRSNVEYFATNVSYSSIFLLCLDEWTGPIQLESVDGTILAELEEKYILGYARYSFKAVLDNLFDELGEIVYSEEAYVPQLLEWDAKKGEDSQAKLLYQSLFYMAMIKPEKVLYLGSGVGGTYATEVFRAYLEEKKIDYDFVDPQASKDIKSSVLRPSDGSLIDVYDGSVMTTALASTSSCVIKATSQVGIDATNRTGNFYETKDRKDVYIAVAKPFHPERMYVPIRKCADYIFGMLRYYTIQQCHCFDCRALHWLSDYYTDTSWFFSAFNTATHHHTNHKWKVPALNKFADMRQAKHSELERFSTVAYNTAAGDRFSFIDHFATGNIAEFGPGNKPYPKADGWSKVNAMPLENDGKFKISSSYKSYTTVIASMSVHHDPGAFLLFCSLLKPVKIIICDETKPSPGRWWNHVGSYKTHSFVKRVLEKFGYVSYTEQSGTNTYSSYINESPRSQRCVSMSSAIPSTHQYFPSRSWTVDIPFYFRPLVIPDHIQGLQFEFSHGEVSTKYSWGKAPYLYRHPKGLGHNAINYGFVVVQDKDDF